MIRGRTNDRYSVGDILLRLLFFIRLPQLGPQGETRLARQILDFVEGGQNLILQRQGMYFGSSLIAAYYYSLDIAVVCFTVCQVTEAVDFAISRRVQIWAGRDLSKGPVFLGLLMVSTLLSAAAVSLFAVLVAAQEGATVHFTPLLFLFTAALFAAMNNHQLLPVLILRLVIYGSTFLFIPLRDLWAVRPPFESELWLQFATAVFVLYFVIDCSFVFLKLYRSNLAQLEERTRERDTVRAAYDAKSKFVSIVSHELRTPLTSIRGGLGMLASGKLDGQADQVARVTGIALRNADTLSNLINDLLDLQKLEAGGMTMTFRKTDLNALVRDAVEAVAEFADAHEISLHLHLAEGPAPVRIDAFRVGQVMSNILSNAIKFSHPQSRIDIRVKQRGDAYRVEVQDYGIGIPEGAEDSVFGTFQQVDGSDQRKIGGSGLGMSIAAQILDGNGSRLRYVSDLGRGTTFFFDLPALTTGSQSARVGNERLQET
jgi:signal transduction histidine kinase